MANKRQQGSAPVFNKSKRPRLALVTHPSNTAPSQPQQTQWSYEKPKPNSQQPWTSCPVQNSYTQNLSYSHSHVNTPQGPSYQQQPPGLLTHNHSSTNYSSAHYQPRPPTPQPNRRPYQPQGPPPPGHKRQSQKPKYYQTSITSYQQNATGYNHQGANYSSTPSYQVQVQENSFPIYPKQPEINVQVAQYENYPPVPQQSAPPPTHQHLASSITTGHVGQVATGQAVEPSKKHVAQTRGTATKESKPRPSLRLLTATAQGMKHWAPYKTHTPLLFEIYGSLTVGVQSVGRVCKQFTLQTSDGPVTCQYWEVDRSLPPLSVGMAHRAVGQWDDKTSVLKCFSVRGVRPGECEGVPACVDATDRVMQKFAGKIHEN